MSRRDTHHQEVVHALQKDQWVVTDDPLTLDFAGKLVGIDLAAEKLLAAEREERKIAIEIKSFQGSSDVSEFHTAVGQFLNYRHGLGNPFRSERSISRFPSKPLKASFKSPTFRKSSRHIGSN